MQQAFRRSARLAAALLWLAEAPCLALPEVPWCADPVQSATVFQRVPEADLKALYLGCVGQSSQRRLSMEEAAHCSNAADVLKVRAFGGDFDAMIGWLQQHREDQHATKGDGLEARRRPTK